MLVNQQTLNIKSTITDDWGGSHRLVLDLKALSEAKDWKIGLDLDDNYEIDQIYGAELIEENGNVYISGADWNQNLAEGSQTDVVLIINEGDSSGSKPVLPEFIFADSDNSNITDINFDGQIVEDWNGGYKLEVDLTAESDAKGWEIDFSLPYTIRATYGVDIIDRGDNNYTISGQNDQVELKQGQSITPIFIIDDNGQVAKVPEVISSTQTAEAPVTQEIVSVEPQIENSTPEQAYGRGKDITAQPEAGSKVINVDSDFKGNLNNAIASANDGDVVRLGNNTYYTNGITINKDITIDGQQGSVINGNGTSESIITLNSSAKGATIQDVEITNGSIGIYGYKIYDLTLQNLDINDIGLNQVNRDGQYNTGIVLNGADGLVLRDSDLSDLGRKGAGVNDTDGATISGLSVQNVNLDAQHAQSHDAAGIKFFNTNDVTVKDSYFSDINAFAIWNDTTNATSIVGNTVVNAGEDFAAPDFNYNVDISGMYNEKSSNSIVKNNNATAVDGFSAFKATEFTTETMVMENNNFSSIELNTQDYWVNEEVEKRIALTEDPYEADFSLFDDEYFAQAEIG